MTSHSIAQLRRRLNIESSQPEPSAPLLRLDGAAPPLRRPAPRLPSSSTTSHPREAAPSVRRRANVSFRGIARSHFGAVAELGLEISGISLACKRDDDDVIEGDARSSDLSDDDDEDDEDDESELSDEDQVSGSER